MFLCLAHQAAKLKPRRTAGRLSQKVRSPQRSPNMSGGILARQSGGTASSRSANPLPILGHFGESQMYVRWRKAAEEQQQFDKARMVSRLASSRDNLPAVGTGISVLTTQMSILIHPRPSRGNRLITRLGISQLGTYPRIDCCIAGRIGPKEVDERCVWSAGCGTREYIYAAARDRLASYIAWSATIKSSSRVEGC